MNSCKGTYYILQYDFHIYGTSICFYHKAVMLSMKSLEIAFQRKTINHLFELIHWLIVWLFMFIEPFEIEGKLSLDFLVSLHDYSSMHLCKWDSDADHVPPGIRRNPLHPMSTRKLLFRCLPLYQNNQSQPLRKKKWSQNGSNPGVVSWYVTQLHRWHYFGATFKGGAVFV